MKTYVIVTIIVLLVLLGLVGFLFSSRCAIPRVLSFSDRIGILQLAVDVIGFGLAIYTGWFAAKQFIQSQIKPKLEVYFENGEKTIEIQRFDIARDAPLSIYVNNLGNGVGRHISLYLSFPPKLDISIEEEDQKNGWRREYNINDDQYFAYYLGSDQFTCYKGFPIYAGKIRIRVQAQGNLENFPLQWKALAENMDIQEGVLYMKFPKHD